MNKFKALAAGSILAFSIASAPANALTLLDLVDPATQSNTPFSLVFVASAASVTLSVAGYQLPSFSNVTFNAVGLTGGGPNLLAPVWAYTPAPSNPLATQPSDGSGVNGLRFGAFTTGSYDVFSQTFATAIGSSYTYNFLFTNPSNSAPSGLRVTVDNANLPGGPGAVPEPATWALMLAGFGLIGGALRRKSRQQARVRVAFA